MRKSVNRAVFLLGLCLMLMVASAQAAPQAADHSADSVNQLKKIDTTVGDGAEAVDGAQVTVNYTGWLYDASAKDHHGAKFDSSLDHGQPFSFVLGQGSVITGWDEGVVGMKVGGERTLIIPSNLAYGSTGAGDDIPPNATLIFDVSLLRVKSRKPHALQLQDGRQ